MQRWGKLFNAQDLTVNPNRTYNELKLALQTIEQHIGGFTLDNILAFTLHFNAQHAYQDIANALDSRIAIDKQIRVSSKNILELISRYCTPRDDIPTSALMSLSSRPQRMITHRDPPMDQGRHTEHPATYMDRSDEWARYWLSWRHPCSYCFDWAHWAIDCPRKKSNLPALKDPRIGNRGIRLKQSSHAHPVFRRETPPHVASISQDSSTDDLVLLDSGATDSVTNNTSFP